LVEGNPADIRIIEEVFRTREKELQKEAGASD